MDLFGLKTSVTVDCFEIFIGRPSNLLAKALAFLNYKHYNIVLIGIAPQVTKDDVSHSFFLDIHSLLG